MRAPSNHNEIKIENSLVNYIVAAWSSFRHSYADWECSSLKEASDKYEWKGNSRTSKNRILDEISKRLIDILRENDERSTHELHHICLEILEWGGVPGISSAWLRTSCENNTLASNINKAVKLLSTGPNHSDWNRFVTNAIEMNSGMTKIYSLASPDEIPIYDGRVGSGICLIVRKFLEDPNLHIQNVPDYLAFRWGAGQNQTRRAEHPRNPSTDEFRFDILRANRADHAECCWRAGVILRKAVNQLRDKNKNVRLRDIEDALFMIGYKVR